MYVIVLIMSKLGQGEKFSTQSTTDVKGGTSGRWVGTRIGDGVTSTLF